MTTEATTTPTAEINSAASLLRHIALGGLASLLAGALVLGIGGRVVMLASRLLHPEAIGRGTENGNRIGDFTVGGTLELIVFGGILSGVLAGIVWTAVRRWLPNHPLAVGVVTTAVGGPFLIEADNRDFTILDDPQLDLVLLLLLLFVFGVVLVLLNRWMDRRAASGPEMRTVYGVVVLAGLPFLIPTVGFFVSREFCFCENPPWVIGVGLMITGVATAFGWAASLRRRDLPSAIRIAGGSGVMLAVLAGSFHTFREISHIL